MILPLLLALLLAPADAPDVTLTGKVVGVTDGDTLTLLVEKTQYKIRLSGIDAPESRQPFGSRAKQSLSGKVFGKTVRVLSEGQDKYGRTLGTVEVDGRNVNVEMVKEGFAWHYKQYSKSKTLAAAEVEARKAKAGLWADPNPIPPWEWRHKEKENRQGAAADPPADGQHWLTESSGVRHNSGCRYYQSSKGRPCGLDEGRACKVCGG
jgi:micrococcal nuclease